MPVKILISDPLAKEGVDILRKNKSFFVEEAGVLPESSLVRRIRNFDALIVRSGTKVTKKVIDSAKKLRIIGRAGVGMDNVDLEAASKKGIVVVNAPTGNTISTAEHAFALMMATARNITEADRSLKGGAWDRKSFKGVELHGKTLGIIGLGRIGVEFAKRARAFDMNILAYDPFLTEEKAKSLDVEPSSLDRLLKGSDIITIHTPLTDDTRHLIGSKAFGKMKKGVRIINAARGGIIDEKALALNLRSGKVAGAALDVFESQLKPPVDSPVYKLENVITTPHLGSSTEEAQLNVAVDIAESVAYALMGKGYRNAVNVPVVSEEIQGVIQPYVDMAEKMGNVQIQLIEDPVRSVTVKYAGEVAKMDTALITRALMKGAFSPILEEHVNYVNSLVMARERGVSIVEKKTLEVTDFASLICVEMKTGKGKHLIMGTLFSNNIPRIVRIDEFYLEAIPEGDILVISNRDVPGIVGKIGAVIGREGVNIAGINLGRDKKRKKAISLINIDSKISVKCLAKLRKIDGVTSVKQIEI